MRDQRRSDVEADPGLAENERVVAEALVGQRIWDDEHVVLLDRVRTKATLRAVAVALVPSRDLNHAVPHPAE
jgi:hypothetical protein